MTTTTPTTTTAANFSERRQTQSGNSIKYVLWTSCLRWILVVLFFVNASAVFTEIPSSLQDVLSIGLVAAIAFLSGYLVTSCYQLAPLQLPVGGDNNVTKQASLLTVAFAFSAVIGLLISFILIAIGV
jgi:hypothetical protein